MASITQSSEPVTSGQTGITEPMQIKIISSGPYLVPQQQPVSVQGNGGDADAIQNTVREESVEKNSSDSSYSETDAGSLDVQISRLVDDIGVKVQNTSECVKNNKKKLKIA